MVSQEGPPELELGDLRPLITGCLFKMFPCLGEGRAKG